MDDQYCPKCGEVVLNDGTLIFCVGDQCDYSKPVDQPESKSEPVEVNG